MFHQDFAALGLYDEVREELRAYVLDKVDDINHVEEGTLVPLEGTLAGQAIATRRAVVVGRDRRREFPSEFARRAFELGLRSGCSAPLLHHNRLIGVMTIASKREDAFTQDDGELLMQIAGQVAIAVENAHAWREVETLRDKLASEKLYLEDEIRTEHNFEELIGESHTFKRILKQVETVAPTDILTKGSDLEVSLAELKSSEPVVATELSTLQEAERDHILRALKETDWVVGGPGGAAARLGMKRTTLQAKMKKLGISRRD